MLVRIIRHDLRLLAADKTLWIVAGIFLVLIAYGTFNGARFTAERAAIVKNYQERGDATLSNFRTEAAAYESGARALPEPGAFAPVPNALMPIRKSVPATLPPASLASLAVGQSDIYPYSATVDVFTVKQALFNAYEQDNPLNLLAGRFDLAFVFVFLFPLLILALSYNLLSQEKESGTLLITLSNAPLSLRRFLTGKVLTRLAVVLIFAIGLSLVGFVLSGVNFSDWETLLRLLLWILAVSVYAVFWFVLAILINAFGFSSAANATALAAIWILLVVVTPALLHVVANAIYPVPSRVEFVSKQREADNYTQSTGEKLLAEYYGDHPELAPDGKSNLPEFASRYFAVRLELQRRILPEVERFDARLSAQQSLIGRFRVMSPAVVMQESLNDIAGNSTERQKEFVNQLREFVDGWQEFFVPRVMRKELFRAADYDQIPRFRFREERIEEIAARVFGGVLLLVFPTGLIAGSAFWRLKRFPLVG